MRRVRLSTAAAFTLPALTLFCGMTAAGAQSADHAGTQPPQHIALNQEQQSRIAGAVRQAKVQPVTNPDLSLAPGAIVPDSVPLTPVPDSIVAVLPQFRNYSFFVDGEHELVFVDPALKKIKARLPIPSEAAVRTTSRGDAGPTGGHSAEGRSRGNDTTSSQADTERSAPHSRKRSRQTEQGDEPANDVARGNGTQPDQPRGTIQYGAGRRRTGHTETDVTEGRSWTEPAETQAPPPVVTRRLAPPARRYGRDQVGPGVSPGPGGPGPAPAPPADHGLFGLFGIFH